jgi:hypothetical protein
MLKGQMVISARTSCGHAIEQRDLIGLVDLRITATPVIIHSGDPITFVVTIANKTQTHLPVVLENAGPHLINQLHMSDARGHEVARDGPCGQGFGSTPTNYMIVIAPGGVAEWRFPWRASTVVTDDGCNESQRPLPTGTYAVTIPVSVGQLKSASAREAHGTLRVQ